MQPLPAANSKCIWTQKIMTRIYKPEMVRQKENCPTLYPDSCLLNDKDTYQMKPKARKKQRRESLSGDQTWAVQELLRNSYSSHSTESLTRPRRWFSVPTRKASKRDVDKKLKYEPVQRGYRQGLYWERQAGADRRAAHKPGDVGGVWARLAKSVSKKVFNSEVKIKEAIFDLRKKKSKS